MIKSLTSFSLLILLSTSAAAQTRPTGTTGATGTSGTTPKTPAPATSAPAAGAASDYRLVNGDKLRVQVYGDDQLTQMLQIRPDGKITLPLIGDIAAAGKTSSQLRDDVAVALEEYMKRRPAVTVIVVETVPKTISVIGEVGASGTQVVAGEVSIIQALATAGGFTEWAKKKDIKVLRPTANGVTTLEFNYEDAIKGKTPILMLRPGDTVIVP